MGVPRKINVIWFFLATPKNVTYIFSRTATRIHVSYNFLPPPPPKGVGMKNVDQLWEIVWKERLRITRGYLTEKCSGIPMMESTTSRDFYDLISSKVSKTCSYTVSCNSWSTTQELWIFRNWWLDFNWLETDLLSLGWIWYQTCWLPAQKQSCLFKLYDQIMNEINMNEHK